MNTLFNEMKEKLRYAKPMAKHKPSYKRIVKILEEEMKKDKEMGYYVIDNNYRYSVERRERLKLKGGLKKEKLR